MRVLFYSLILLAFTSCLPKEVKESNNASTYKWDIPFPLTLSISSDFDSTEVNDIRTSANNWDTAINSSVNLLNTSTTTTSKSNDLRTYEDSVMGVYKIYNWPNDLPDRALAVAQIFGTRQNIGSSSEYIQINHADILVNYDSSFNYFTTNGYDLQSVILHEMGHFLGLLHEESSPEESVMYKSISRWNPNRIPRDNDIVKLKGLYNFGPGNSVQPSRSLASSSTKVSSSQPVVILFEATIDGEEKVTIKDANTNEIISQDTIGCGHSK